MMRAQNKKVKSLFTRMTTKIKSTKFKDLIHNTILERSWIKLREEKNVVKLNIN